MTWTAEPDEVVVYADAASACYWLEPWDGGLPQRGRCTGRVLKKDQADSWVRSLVESGYRRQRLT
jgi:hypothetical protein